MKVVALCAGKGTRLGVSDINKSMILLQNRPLLEYSLNNLSEIDEVDEFIIVIGFAGEQNKKSFSTEL